MYNKTITGRERHTKRILAAILALMLALIPACLAEQACTIHFTAGEAPAASADIETNCIEIDGVRYVPLDAVAEGLGYSYSVDILEADAADAITGKWTCTQPNLNSTMELNEDGSCVLIVGDTRYRLSWALENNVILLTQNEVSLQADYDPDHETIALHLDDNIIPYSR